MAFYPLKLGKKSKFQKSPLYCPRYQLYEGLDPVWGQSDLSIAQKRGWRARNMHIFWVKSVILDPIAVTVVTLAPAISSVA